MKITKYLLTAVGIVAGSYCIPAAFQSGLAIGVGINGYIIGVVMVSVVVGSWLLGPLALTRFRDRAWWQGGFLSIAWVATFALVLVNSVGFTANQRGETIGSKVAAISRYDNAQADKNRLTDELKTLRADDLWRKTGGCAKSDFDYSNYRAYCTRVQALQKRIDAASTQLAAGRPAVGDAQAETLASMFGQSPVWVAQQLPFWITIGMEVAANAFLFAAQAVSGKPRASRRKPRRRSRRSAKAGGRRPVEKLVRSERFPNVYYPADRPVADFRTEKALRALARRASR